jgi:TonB family protein
MLIALALCASGARAQEAPKVAGSDVPAPRRTKTVLPEYPPSAQAQGIRGIVILDIVIDTEGHVASAEVLRSIPGLDEAALVAVRQWQFEVTKVDGKPVSVRLNVPITFTIKPPEVSRDKGIPPLQQGVPPAYPGDLTDKSATVTAQVALDTRGSVVDALITSGESPWTDSLLRALRTWRFVVEPPGRALAFKVEAKFAAGSKGQPPKVDLRLTEPREGPAPAAATGPTVSPGVAPSPTPQTPPEAQSSPEAGPVTEPSPSPQPPPTEPAPAAQPPIETLPAPPPPTTEPTRPPESGVSSVPDVTLLGGIPDLVKGRHPVPPPLARINGVTGSVTVRFAVNAAGFAKVEDVQGPDLLKPAAQDTVSSWTFHRTAAQRLHLVASFDYKEDTATATVEVESKAPSP